MGESGEARNGSIEETRATLQRYRDLFELAPDGYLVTDLDGKILEANLGAEKLFRQPREALRLRRLGDLVADQDHKLFATRLGALAGGRASRLQDWQVTFDLPTIDHPDEAPGAPTFEAELTVERAGARSMLSWLVRDVTEKRRAEELLRQQMARSRAILESAVDGIITIDEKGIVQSMNPAAESIFGYDDTEIVGGNVSVLMPEPDRGRHDGYLRNYLVGGEARIIGIGREVFGRRKDGSQFPMDLAVNEVQVGERRWFMGTVRDITDRKETERALVRERDFAESLVETAQAIVLVLDQDGRIVRYNRYMEDLSGVPLDEVRGESWFETFIPHPDRERVGGLFDIALAGQATRGNVNAIVTRDGEQLDIEWFDTLIVDEDGNVSGILAVGQDLTPRRRLEEQIRQAQKLEAIGRLAGGIAHDFNTLLGSITGYTEMLLDRLDTSSNLREPTRQIHRAADRGAALTRQLLAFSRRQLLQPKVFDLNDVVREMEGLIQRLIGADIELEHRFAAQSLPVRIDVSQMEQVLMNLVVNACDAMPRGGALRIETSLGADDAPTAPSVQLRVADTGHGMDEETRSRIFEPFFTTKEAGKGTGLGLSTVYGIITQSQGEVRVESRVDEGTTFVISLPLADGDHLPLPRRDEAPKAAAEGGSETILLVEDDTMFRDLLTEVLENKGYRVWSAADPDEALALCARGEGTPPDLLVSDMVMPGALTGAELADRLREDDPDLRVLLMSGYTDEDLAERGSTSHRASAFIQKPFSTKDFAGKVRELLDLDG